jgi:hypothetical protein
MGKLLISRLGQSLKASSLKSWKLIWYKKRRLVALFLSEIETRHTFSRQQSLKAYIVGRLIPENYNLTFLASSPVFLFL